MKGIAHCGYPMIAELIDCLTIVSQWRFDRFPAGLHQAIAMRHYKEHRSWR